MEETKNTLQYQWQHERWNIYQIYDYIASAYYYKIEIILIKDYYYPQI